MKRLTLALLFILIILALPYVRARAQGSIPTNECIEFAGIIQSDMESYNTSIRAANFESTTHLTWLIALGYRLQTKYESAPAVCETIIHASIIVMWSKNNEVLFWVLASLIEPDSFDKDLADMALENLRISRAIIREWLDQMIPQQRQSPTPTFAPVRYFVPSQDML